MIPIYDPWFKSPKLPALRAVVIGSGRLRPRTFLLLRISRRKISLKSAPIGLLGAVRGPFPDSGSNSAHTPFWGLTLGVPAFIHTFPLARWTPSHAALDLFPGALAEQVVLVAALARQAILHKLPAGPYVQVSVIPQFM